MCAHLGVAGINLGASRFPAAHADNTDAGSNASGFSDASTADAAGLVYDLEQRSPAALFMSPSASFGDNDCGYEPTMSPGAFQAAMAAGLLAALPAKQSKEQEVGPPVLQDTAADAVLTGTAAAPSPDEKVESAQDASIASNSIASAKLGLLSTCDSTAAAQASPTTPASKATCIGDSADQGTAADPASPAASTNAAQDSSGDAVSRPAAQRATLQPEAEAVSMSPQNSADTSTAEQSKGLACHSPTGSGAGPPTVGAHSATHAKLASSQMAEIAAASDQAQSSAVGPEVDSAVSPAAEAEVGTAVSALPTSAGCAVPEASGVATTSASTAAAVTAGKGLFSATKRPAEVRLRQNLLVHCLPSFAVVCCRSLLAVLLRAFGGQGFVKLHTLLAALT